MSDKIKIGTVGLGLMGSSIATCILAAGHPVTSITRSAETGISARQRIHEFLQQLKDEGFLTEDVDAALARLTITDDYEKFKDHEVVIESIIENIEEKKKVYKQLETVLSPSAIIGSNTSAIPVTLLQQGLQHPERLFGIHWAEPAHITRFMEIICGDATNPELADKIIHLAEGWGKEPSLLKKDIRGFITNRIMYAMMREAFHLVENGYATIQDVDRSLRNDLGYWITFAGPFRFMDLTGIPAYLSVMKDLFPELSNSDKAPESIRKIVDEGGKGVANAKGFYNYSDESASKWEDEFVKFSFDIRKLAAKYPQDIGETISKKQPETETNGEAL
jgi:3-hydroxybutyryl-CoA dehydrogenase